MGHFKQYSYDQLQIMSTKPKKKKKKKNQELGQQIIMQAPRLVSEKIQERKIFNSFLSFSVLVSLKKRLKHVTKNKKAPNSTTIIF